MIKVTGFHSARLISVVEVFLGVGWDPDRGRSTHDIAVVNPTDVGASCDQVLETDRLLDWSRRPNRSSISVPIDFASSTSAG